MEPQSRKEESAADARLAALLSQRAAQKALLQELEASLPIHSVKPQQLFAIEEAEQALEDIDEEIRRFRDPTM